MSARGTETDPVLLSVGHEPATRRGRESISDAFEAGAREFHLFFLLIIQWPYILNNLQFIAKQKQGIKTDQK